MLINYRWGCQGEHTTPPPPLNDYNIFTNMFESHSSAIYGALKQAVVESVDKMQLKVVSSKKQKH